MSSTGNYSRDVKNAIDTVRALFKQTSPKNEYFERKDQWLHQLEHGTSDEYEVIVVTEGGSLFGGDLKKSVKLKRVTDDEFDRLREDFHSSKGSIDLVQHQIHQYDIRSIFELMKSRNVTFEELVRWEGYDPASLQLSKPENTERSQATLDSHIGSKN